MEENVSALSGGTMLPLVETFVVNKKLVESMLRHYRSPEATVFGKKNEQFLSREKMSLH